MLSMPLSCKSMPDMPYYQENTSLHLPRKKNPCLLSVSMNHIVKLYPFAQRSCWGGGGGGGGVYIGFIPSVRPSLILCPLCSAYSSGWIDFIFVHLIKQLQKVCRMYSFLQNFKIWSFDNFLEICNFDFVFFWLGIWCESLVWVIMGGGGGGISECRHSSCSSFYLINTWIIFLLMKTPLQTHNWDLMNTLMPETNGQDFHGASDRRYFILNWFYVKKNLLYYLITVYLSLLILVDLIIIVPFHKDVDLLQPSPGHMSYHFCCFKDT